MTTTAAPTAPINAFLTRWQSAGGAERANYQLFLTELADLLHVPRPNPATNDDSKNTYVFDRSITVTHPDGSTSTNFIDLYYRQHFVLETKQGIEAQDKAPPGKARALPLDPGGPPPVTDTPPLHKPKLKKGHGIRSTKLRDDAMIRPKAPPGKARAPTLNQDGPPLKHVPPGDNPPVLLVIDVGYSIETYADFSGLGKTYTPLPDNLSHRFKLTDLLDEKAVSKADEVVRGPVLFPKYSPSARLGRWRLPSVQVPSLIVAPTTISYIWMMLDVLEVG